MTFHPRSAVEFGLFLTRVSESLLSGVPLSQSLEMIRVQLGGSAAALRIEDRLTPGHGPLFIAGVDTAAGADGARLSDLLETSHHVTSTTVSELDGTRFTLWIFRERSRAAFDGEELSVCEMLVAHVRRSMELSQRIGASEIERTLYSNVMDRLCVGVVILDLSGRVVRCSHKAEEALAARDGLQLQAGKLRATSAKEDRDLQAAIKAAIQAASGGEAPASRGLALTKLSGNRTLGVIVQPVQGTQRAGVAAAPTVAIYIRDPEANADVESDLVRQLFDLTPAEAAVARRLTAGLSLEDAANSLDISRNTARAHLRSIFSKSGITRQTELVRMMLNSAAVLGEPARAVA
jgi:DNA-binding CsgD family transcriptional regulator/PAS domain-containing protein